MPPQEENKNSKNFEGVIDALHNKAKLPSLRTYKGDMAEFIKSKNESVISIALKEKERKEERKREEFEIPRESVVSDKKEQKFQINLIAIFLSLLLVGGGVLAAMFVFDFFTKEQVSTTTIEEKIIPYNNSITLANTTKSSLVGEASKFTLSNGINIINMSDINGLPIKKTSELINLFDLTLPPNLLRTVKEQFAFGAIRQDENISYFLVLKAGDFGQAFSGMLDWEENMLKDLFFFDVKNNASGQEAESVATTTISNKKIEIKPEIFSWKDVIVKNKDTRAFANEKKQAKIAYTFLDKNTILITSSLSAISDISQAYASRAVAR